MPEAGGVGRDVRLTDADMDFIEKITRRDLRDLSGAPRSLPNLVAFRMQWRVERERVMRDHGPASREAAWANAVVHHLDLHIAEAQSPLGVTSEKLHNALDAHEKSGDAITADSAIPQIINTYVAELRKKEKTSGGAGIALKPSPTAKFLAAEVNRVLEKRRLAERREAKRTLLRTAELVSKQADDRLEALIAKARRPGSYVSDDQIARALATAITAEKRLKKWGKVSDTEVTRTSTLLYEVLDLGKERTKRRVESLIQAAKEPDSKVTDEQLGKANVDMFAAGHVRAVSGATEGEAGPSRSMELHRAQIEIFYQRHKAELLALVGRAGQANSNITRKQIESAVKKLHEDRREKSLVQGEDGALENISDVMDEAMKVWATLPPENER